MSNEKPHNNTFPEIDPSLLDDAPEVKKSLIQPGALELASEKQEPALNLRPKQAGQQESQKRTVTTEQLGSLANATLSKEVTSEVPGAKLKPIQGAVIEDLLGGSELEGATLEEAEPGGNILKWRQKSPNNAVEENYGKKRAAEDEFGKRGAA